jgi:GPH family glycoside/pentoside/hexuronide:cation symporter
VVGSLAFLLLTPANTVVVYALMLFSGFTAIGIWVTQMAASADVIEWDEERTGTRQEGAYGGLTSMSVKLAIASSMLIVGPLLSRVGYIPGAAHLAPAAANNIRLLFTLVPASFYSLAALVFSRYPITRETHRAVRERIADRAAAELAAKSLAS